MGELLIAVSILSIPVYLAPALKRIANEMERANKFKEHELQLLKLK